MFWLVVSIDSLITIGLSRSSTNSTSPSYDVLFNSRLMEGVVEGGFSFLFAITVVFGLSAAKAGVGTLVDDADAHCGGGTTGRIGD